MSRDRQITLRPSMGGPSREPSVTTVAEPRALPLQGGLRLSAGETVYTLHSPKILIGRAAHCRIVLDDPLISREHAMLHIGPDEVSVEDLRSSNGVWVNNVRIFETTPLRDGDQILLGVQELRATALPPTTLVTPLAHVQDSIQPAYVKQKPSVSTARADALLVLGRLAARKLADNAPHEAEKVLEDHLMKLLAGARSGLPIPEATCATASKQALLLASALGSGRWVDYAVELHLRAARTMASSTFTLLEEASRNATGADRGLFQYYLDVLRLSAADFDEEERLVFDKLTAVKLL